MFNCRMCTENPFAKLFEPSPSGGNKKNKKKAAAAAAVQQEQFTPRNEAEMEAIISQWAKYAHPRAREFFTSPEQLEEVLQQLAKSIHRTDDPILGPEDRCVYWHGDVTKDDGQAAIRMVKPGEAAESVTYVNRVLAFIFATDESFDQLMRLPKEPFTMHCGDQLCVHLAHISLTVGSADGM